MLLALLYVDVMKFNCKFGEAICLCLFLSAMLYVAPEILRKCPLSNHSLQKADVYSFAIIAQEILFRAGPFPVVEGVEITFEGKFLLFTA